MSFISEFSQAVTGRATGMGFRKLEKIFRFHTYVISFVTKLGEYGWQKTFSAEKQAIKNQVIMYLLFCGK